MVGDTSLEFLNRVCDAGRVFQYTVKTFKHPSTIIKRLFTRCYVMSQSISPLIIQFMYINLFVRVIYIYGNKHIICHSPHFGRALVRIRIGFAETMVVLSRQQNLEGYSGQVRERLV